MITFFIENIDFSLKEKKKIKEWVGLACVTNNKKITDINYIFCSDAYLLEINKEYLNHDFFTDIITFDQSEAQNTIAGDIYISIDRVRENAIGLNINFNQELKRVLIHGVLHLIGYKDKSKKDKAVMRKQENVWLNKYVKMFHVEQ